MARAREARAIEEQAAEAIRRALPAEFVAEIEGKDPEARKRRRIEGNYNLDGYQAPDDIHFARGQNAVNPRGREGFEMEYQEPPMIEDGTAAGDGPQAGATHPAETTPAASNGIFSSSTLAALGKAQVSLAAKPKSQAPAGPLVGYGSDSDDDDE